MTTPDNTDTTVVAKADVAVDQLLTSLASVAQYMTLREILLNAVLTGITLGLNDARRIHREEQRRALFNNPCTECGNHMPYHRATCSRAAENPITQGDRHIQN